MEERNDKAFVQNTANPEQVKEASQRERHGRIRDLQDLRAVLSTANGRRFLWRLLGMCKVYAGGFTDNPNYSMYRDGRRDVGFELLNDINEADENGYLNLVMEAKKDHV